MKQIVEQRLSGTPRSLLLKYHQVMPDFDIDDFARSSNTIPEPLLAPTVEYVLEQAGNTPSLEWLFNNCGMPYTGEVFVDVFYDDCEIRLRWEIDTLALTGYALASAGD